MQCSQKSHDQLAYAYLLTHDGITKKPELIVSFLESKADEYESSTLEVEALKSEMSKAQTARLEM